MKRIAVVSCDKWINKIQEDLLLVQSLNSHNYQASLISWEDPNVDYRQFDCLVIRSVWGYQNKYVEFKKWLQFLKNNHIKVFNNIDIILNNIYKKKQFEILDKYFIPHIPTLFIEDFNSIKNVDFFENSVAKPIISGSGDNTFRISNSADSSNFIKPTEIIHYFSDKILQEDNGIMIQPYFNGIQDGEYACIYISGENTHNMMRFPGLFSPKQKPSYILQPPESVKKLALMVSKIPEFSGYLYMRIDIVIQNNIPYIMEVELAEPDLLLKYVPKSIQNNVINEFCRKLERRLR